MCQGLHGFNDLEVHARHAGCIRENCTIVTRSAALIFELVCFEHLSYSGACKENVSPAEKSEAPAHGDSITQIEVHEC